MLGTLKRLVTHVCTPDELDMIEHYQTRAERLADLWVHAVGLMLAAVGGVDRIDARRRHLRGAALAGAARHAF